MATQVNQSSSSASSIASTTPDLKGKNAKNKPSYKHVPHSQKPPHLVAKRNARERRRVQAVNQAFYKLRKCVPIENRNKRVSKVKTLQRAIDYIRKLERILEQDDAESNAPAADVSQLRSVNIVDTGSAKRTQNISKQSSNCDQSQQLVKQRRGRKPTKQLEPEQVQALKGGFALQSCAELLTSPANQVTSTSESLKFAPNLPETQFYGAGQETVFTNQPVLRESSAYNSNTYYAAATATEYPNQQHANYLSALEQQSNLAGAPFEAYAAPQAAAAPVAGYNFYQPTHIGYHEQPYTAVAAAVAAAAAKAGPTQAEGSAWPAKSSRAEDCTSSSVGLAEPGSFALLQSPASASASSASPSSASTSSLNSTSNDNSSTVVCRPTSTRPAQQVNNYLAYANSNNNTHLSSYSTKNDRYQQQQQQQSGGKQTNAQLLIKTANGSEQRSHQQVSHLLNGTNAHQQQHQQRQQLHSNATGLSTNNLHEQQQYHHHYQQQQSSFLNNQLHHQHHFALNSNLNHLSAPQSSSANTTAHQQPNIIIQDNYTATASLL